MGKCFAYVRVSTNSQNADRQFNALKEYSKNNKIEYDIIFEDRISGKDFIRPQYQLMREKVRRGDIVVVKELDRLGRNYEDIKNELDYFYKQGIKVIVLDLPILNIGDEKLSNVINDIILNLLSYIAEKEIIKLRQRVREGIHAARERGTKLGRPAVEIPKSFYKYYDKWCARELKTFEFARLVGVSSNQIYVYVRKIAGTGRRIS